MASIESARYFNKAISVLKLGVMVLGIVLIAVFLENITVRKFQALRTEIASQEVVGITASERVKQLDCLTKNIYWEAANEPFEGKVAVAQVTINRVASGKFGSGVCGVVYQKNVFYEKVICQFSWACETKYRTQAISAKQYVESEEVAKRVLLENFRLPSLTQAMFYHAAYIKPGWDREKINQIGQHIFYK